MAKKFPKYFAEELGKRYSDNPKKILVVNGVLSGYQKEEKLIPLLEEDLGYSERRIKIKRLERGTLLREIEKDKQEVKKLTRLLKYLGK